METNEKIRPAIYQMDAGDIKEFDIAKLKTIRTQCSELGAIYDRQYTTRTDRPNRKIVVTRVS